MKRNTFQITKLVLLLLFTHLCCTQQSMSDFIIPRTNSKAIINQTIASTQIEIKYNRPNKREREIFGALVPYDKIWRTGSDEATEIYFSTPVSLQGTAVDSGRYQLFTIPAKNEWTVILQKKLRQWGSYGYNPENDVAKVTVTPSKSDKTIETFTISMDHIGSDRGTLTLSWDQTIVPIEVKVDLMSTVVPQLETSLKESERRPYFQAAMFYYENKININRAAELMAMALKDNPGHIGMLYRYALILKQKGDISDAIKASEESLSGAQKVGPELKTEYTKLNSNLLNELKAMKN